MAGKQDAAEKPSGIVWCDSKGQTLRDYFAAHCPDSELMNVSSISGGAAALELGVDYTKLTPAMHLSALRKIRCRERYAYADAMLEARKP